MDGDNNMQGQTPSSGSGGGKSAMIWVAIIIVAAVAVFALSRGGQREVEDAEQEQHNGAMMEDSDKTEGEGMMEDKPAGGMMDGGGMMQKEVKVFTVDGENFKFSPAEIRVKKDDTVKIVFNNKSGFHDFVLDEFSVKTKQANGPMTEEVQFVASKAGTFEFYCSVGQHRAMGMKGMLIVEEK